MQEIAKKWNRRYKALEQMPQVNENLKRFVLLAPKGKALDIACGAGQNAHYLASLGFEVDAIDIAQEGLAFLQGVANVNPICADICRYELAKERYKLILCTNFLERSIFPKMIAALSKGGVLIYETFTYKRSNFNQEFLLQKNELLHLLDALEIVHYELQEDKALCVARKEE